MNGSLFNEAFGGGYEIGRKAASDFRATRQRSQLSELADLARGMPGGVLNPEVLNQTSNTLLRHGNVDGAIQLANRPNELAQQQQEYDLKRQGVDLRRAELDHRMQPKPASPLSNIGRLNQDFDQGFITKEQRNAAIAKSNAVRNGITIRNPDGTVTQIGGSGNAVGRKATNELQSGIISNTELLSLTDSVRDSFRPEFLTYKGAGEQFFTHHAEKLGLDVGSARKQFLGDRTKFVTQTERLFNAYRKEITGAAAAVQELDRLKKSFLNVDQSPSEFEATLDSYQNELKRTIRLRNRILREGLDPRTVQGGAMMDNLFLTNADDDVEQRGAELAAQGLSEQEILQTLDQEGY